MSAEDGRRLRVVLGWHMHQPWYLDPLSRRYVLPWVYLHAIKDYADMAAHLEQAPAARAVVNFAPSLLEQLADYQRDLAEHRRHGQALKDPLLDALARLQLPADPAALAEIVGACLRANESQVTRRFPAYGRLVDFARPALEQPALLHYLSPQFLADLLVWYHLVWLGETVRRADSRVQTLMDKRQGYTVEDRGALVQVIADLLGGLGDRYRELAECGRVELSVSPWAHPMLPLLLDLESAREAMPGLPLPVEAPYPGGPERARWQMQEALRSFQACFGALPAGCWPSEGGLSGAVLALLEEFGFAWTATGTGVLNHSLEALEPQPHPGPHHAFRFGDSRLRCFFRDDGLSDLIGFNYAGWHADDAVADLVQHLLRIREHLGDCRQAVVPIILDGENAWEHYPDNGYHFLSGLYRTLGDHPQLRLCTFSDVLAEGIEPLALPGLVAGSWVYGNFTTWVGHGAKNRAWDLLIAAKRAFDRRIGELGTEAQERARRQLGVCEGSDWFWWFGDHNPAPSVRDFDRLYRRQLRALYQILELPAPAELDQVISRGGGDAEHGGVMRRGQEG